MPRFAPLSMLLTALLLAATPAADAPLAQPAPWLQSVRALAISQLDAELRRARQQHIDGASPLPEQVKKLMKGLVPDDVLAQARYTVSVDASTLPALLNRGHRELLEQDHAVSVPDLIIFSREPGLDSGADARWWGHELGHLLQYRRWGGSAGFAQRYVDDFQAVEREAEALGQQALRRYVSTPPTGSSTADTPSTSTPATIATPATGAPGR